MPVNIPIYRLSFISGEIQSVSERLPDNPGVGIACEQAPEEWKKNGLIVSI